MFIGTKQDQGGAGCGRKTLEFLTRIARCRKGSKYYRMESDLKKEEDKGKGKAGQRPYDSSKEVKGKAAKKGGWKRIRQAALASCRYLGMGAIHMNPAAMYPYPEYAIDPKYWHRSFSSSYKPKHQQQPHHWTSNMMYSSW